MEHSKYNAEMLESISCPALIVEGGIITHANQAAMQRGVELNTEISALISIGAEEYPNYTEGKLCLTLCIGNISYDAVVTTAGNYHIFSLATDYEEPELRAFALAAQQLREPLANAMLGAEQLLPNLSLQQDAEAKQQLGQINRSLYQLLRAVSNMSDAAYYAKHHACHFQTQDLVSVFEEILEKASALASQAERELKYTLPKQSVFGLADIEKLERAILNLISNAIKYAPKGGQINAVLRKSNQTLIFTIQGADKGNRAQAQANIFSRFLREPGLDDVHAGIGLGMTIVRSVAAAHGGTVLMEQPDSQGMRITLTLKITQSNENFLRTPVLLPVDYAGGRDHSLLELSDVLPNALFEENI